jgi:predicted nucleic acid-binding protein
MPILAMTAPAPILVLDTNVVLDWLVFADAGCAAVSQAIVAGKARWFATEPMRIELQQVLTRNELGGRQLDIPAVLAAWDRLAQVVPPAPPAAQPGWQCDDPDDQMFVELALHHRAAALLTRDRALLRLARRARELGIEIVPANRWKPPAG